MAKIKICPLCQTENPAHRIECDECGADLMYVKMIDSEASGGNTSVVTPPTPAAEMIRICSECGAENPAQARKCQSCQEDISDIRPVRKEKHQEICAVRRCLSSLIGDYALELPCEAGELILGRQAEMSDYLAGRQYVSRRQAKLIITGDQVIIEELSHTNPTFVNNEPLTEGEKRTLCIGDEVGLGGKVIEGIRQEQAAYFVLSEIR